MIGVLSIPQKYFSAKNRSANIAIATDLHYLCMLNYITITMRRFFCIIFYILALTFTTNAASITTSAGGVASAVGDNTQATSLIVSGQIDASDFEFIANVMKSLETLDISNATIVEYHGKPIITSRTDFAANTLPAYALAGTQIKNIKLPNNLLVIDEGAFLSAAIESIVIPQSVTTIGNNALADCDNITTIEIPATLISLGEYAFMGCDNLQSVNMGNGITSIATATFKDCGKLSSITLPDMLSRIGSETFAGCRSLATIAFPGSLANIGDYAFYKSGIESLNLTDTSVNRIGSWAFAQCENLSQVILDDRISNLGEGVFFDCNNLTTYNTPEACSIIAKYAHKGNTSLLADKLAHNNLSIIGDYAFMGMSNVSNIQLPVSVDSIGSNAFEDWTALKFINMPDHQSVPRLGQNVWQDVNQADVILYVNDEMILPFSVADQWKEFKVMATVGIDNLTSQPQENTIKAHFSGSDLIITASDKIDIASVYDSMGRACLTIRPHSNNATIDTSSWCSNIYILKVILNNTTSATFKLAR